MINSAYFSGILLLAVNTAFAGELSSITFKDLNEQTLRSETLIPSVPVPGSKYNQQNMALAKIKLNEAQPDMNYTLVAKLKKGLDIDAVLKELTEAGFKAKACADGGNYYFVMVDASGIDAGDAAIGLAKYYYVTEVQVGQKIYNSIFVVKSRSAFAVKIGTIKGGMNLSPVDITINKLAWTITGAINHSPVDIKINHDDKTITGGANQSPVDLKFIWSQEEVTVEGGANQSPVKYAANWKNGLLEGYSNNSPLRVEFAMNEGIADETIVKLTGYANHAPIDLTFNKINGHLGGAMDGSPMDITLVNCDLYDFLQYFFLFVK